MSNPNGAKGASFERLVADYLRDTVDDRIDRRVKTGAKDCGDIAGVRLKGGHRVVIEAKNCKAQSMGAWLAEAQVEAENDGAILGVVVSKRRGKGQAADQYVTMTLADLSCLLQLLQ